MGLDIFFKEDIANALAAAEQAASAVGTYSDDARAAAFLAGWKGALKTLATAFGIPPDLFDIRSPLPALPPPREQDR